jgi:hypothetical protein
MTVCVDLERFARTHVTNQDTLDANAICNVYNEFAYEMGTNIQAYEHVVHKDHSKGIPSPIDHERALRSSRLVNTADGHRVRDGTGKTPTPFSGAMEGCSCRFALLLGVFVVAAIGA